MANCYHLTFNLRDNGVRLPPKLLLVTKVTVFKRFLKDKVLKKKRKYLKTIFCVVYSVHDIGKATEMAIETMDYSQLSGQHQNPEDISSRKKVMGENW